MDHKVAKDITALHQGCEQRMREGVSLDASVVDAGAVRFRPMFMTAMAVIVGGAVIPDLPGIGHLFDGW
jgi:multidrug efflux pump subunit AcrB